MKKLPTTILSTLIMGLALIPSLPTHATIEENGTTWWSVGELLNFYPEVEAEKAIECGDNQDCRMEFGFNMIEKGGKYRALSRLIDMQFWVTSVNPNDQSLKVLFFDEEMMLKRMGIEEKISLEKLTIGWFDEWKDQVFHHSFDELTSGSVSDYNLLYTGTSPEALSDITPWKESSIQFSDPNLADNHSGRLAYYVYASPFNAVGMFDYSSCLRNLDYEYGSECKMYISSEERVSYFPPRQEASEQPIAETTTEELVTDTTEPQDDTNQSAEVSSGNREEVNNTTGITDTTTSSTVTDTTITPSDEPVSTSVEMTSPKAPNTGKGTCEQIVEFPWWFMGLLTLVDIVALWLFWPTKSIKKSKKH